MQFAVVAFVVLTIVSSSRAIQLARPCPVVSVSVQAVHAFSNVSQPSFALAQPQPQPQPTPPAFALALVAALGLLAVITGISPAVDFKSVSPPTPAQAQPAASVPTPLVKPDEKPEEKHEEQAPIEEAAIEEQETSAAVADEDVDEEDAQFIALPPRRPLAPTLGAQTLPPHLRLQASARGVPDLVRTVTKRNMLRRQRAERLAQQQQLVTKPALLMPVHPRLAGVPSLSLAVPAAPQLAMPTHPRLGAASPAAHPLAPVAMSAPTPGPRRRPAPLSLAPIRTLSLTIVTDA